MQPTETPGADLEALFRECGRELAAYFARRHGGTQLADDLVQETFLQLARRLRAGKVPASPRGYLFGIARHLSLGCFRRQAPAVEPLDLVSDTAASAKPDERSEAAREIIAALPALQREVLDLRFAHGLSYAETATALGVPVGTVRSRLHHAVALLRRSLEADGHDDPKAGPPQDPQHLPT